MCQYPLDRRSFLRSVALGTAGVLGSGRLLEAAATEPAEVEVSPSEDLMREHGVLARVLLVHEEIIRRLETGQQLPVDVLTKSMQIVHEFIEGYHEVEEEQFIFPLLRKHNQMVQTVDLLERQHQVGRIYSPRVDQLISSKEVASRDSQGRLIQTLRAFAAMYRPHAAREDTEVFPTLRRLMNPTAWHELGEQMEEAEHQRLGNKNFEYYVRMVAQLEQQLGINDLAKFTPKDA